MKPHTVRSSGELRQILDRYFEVSGHRPEAALTLDMLIDGILVEIRLTGRQGLLIGYLGRSRDLGRDVTLRAARLALSSASSDGAGLAYDEAGDLLALTCPLASADAPGLLDALHLLVGQAVTWGDALGRRSVVRLAPGPGWEQRWRPV